jgi:hypothetical protein
MHFLPDVYVQCEACEGRRYNRETLEVRYRQASIADVLDMTVSQACEFLENIPKLRQKLETLREVGLGYVKLGQSATTLSGGEAQRVKLSKELAKKATGRTVYILDEPDHRPALRRHRPAAAGAGAPGRRGEQRHRDRTQPGCDQGSRLDPRSGPRGWPRGGQIVAQGPPTTWPRPRPASPGNFCGKSCRPARPSVDSGAVRYYVFFCMSSLLERIKNRSANVVVVGAGYVGLPLAVEIAKAGFSVTAYDRSSEKVSSINAGRSYIDDVPTSIVGPLVADKKLVASTDPDVLGKADAVIICVPTPLNKTKDPDNSFILDAADMMVSRMHPQQLVVLESTTFPGFTREVLLPKLSASGLKVDKDFFIAFSPSGSTPGTRSSRPRTPPR